MANNSTNINKTKESFISDGQQFHQYQKNKRKFKHWWPTIPPISTKQKKAFVLLILVELLTITDKAFFCFVDIGGIVGHQCLNFLLFCWPISTKQKKALSVMVKNSTNINKTKESLNSDGQQFHQYQQNKRKLLVEFLTITV
jgi:hypothetical protein